MVNTLTTTDDETGEHSPSDTCPCQQCSVLAALKHAKQINDGTAGHSKGNWQASGQHLLINLDPDPAEFTGKAIDCQDSPDAHLLALAQSAPHDCGDPECPGYQNKRKLELYDKFQTAIHEFAKAGLLT